MCGIFGCVNVPGDIRPQLAQMASVQKCRGPDSEGFYLEPGACLGMVRLAIVDPAGGAQPVFSPGRRHLIVYNGQIYNHRELRKELNDYPFTTASDTETLLAAYLRWGEGCLPRLNGIFAFAVWDRLKKELFFARDRFGAKPFHMARSGAAFYFSSEAKGLLPFLGTPAPDEEALSVYLQLGYIPSPLCAFSGIEKLPQGHMGRFTGNELTITPWFHVNYGQRRAPQKALAAELDALLDNAIKMELMSDVPLGVMLSGGIDSSLVAACAAAHDPEIQSFSLGFSESTHDESSDARLAADFIGLRNHQELRLSDADLPQLFDDAYASLDEPFADCTVMPLLAISRFAKKSVKTVLTGMGGDEIFIGYPTFLAHRVSFLLRCFPDVMLKSLFPRLIAKLPVSDKYMSLGFKAQRFLLGAGLSPEKRHLAWMGYFRPSEIALLTNGNLSGESAFLENTVNSLSGPDTISRILELDLQLFAEGNGLFQTDRMSMLASLEARVPFYNPAIAQWANNLAWDCKMPGLKLKSLLKAVAKNKLPERLLHKPKKGFGPPVSQWLRGGMKKIAGDVLNPDRLAATGWIAPEAVHALWVRHQARTADNGRQLWCVLSLQYWLEHFYGKS